MRYITKSLTGINTKSRYRGLFLVVVEISPQHRRAAAADFR
jgi:hypothetical protein